MIGFVNGLNGLNGVKAVAFALAGLVPAGAALAADAPTLEILWPAPDTLIALGDDAEAAIGIVVKSNLALLPAGRCGANPRCGHVHMKIDPDDDSCNIPGRPYNSMNSDTGGDLVKARFGHCPSPAGRHVIGILLADDHHRPILVDGKPVTALVTVTTTLEGQPAAR